MVRLARLVVLCGLMAGTAAVNAQTPLPDQATPAPVPSPGQAPSLPPGQPALPETAAPGQAGRAGRTAPPPSPAVAPGAPPPAQAGPRRPRSFQVCMREAAIRHYRGAERRHFVFRCQLGYGRRLFRRRGPPRT